jgi:hypothetical protein
MRACQAWSLEQISPEWASRPDQAGAFAKKMMDQPKGCSTPGQFTQGV